MKIHANRRARVAALALVFGALASGCGGSGSAPSAAAPAPAPAAPLDFGAFPSAFAVLGQGGFEVVAPDGTPGTLSYTRGEPAVAADGRLFVVDDTGLKIFSRYDQNGAFEDFPGIADPRSVSIQSGSPGRLVVIDGDKVRIFDSATPGAAQIAEAGSAAACNASGLIQPTSAHLTPAGQLVVADSGNHRVLIWNNLNSTVLGDANVVVGQPDMTTCLANAGRENPGSETLSDPQSVWSDGRRLVVADTGNNRVLVWESLPSTDSQPASTVIGQRDPISGEPNAGSANPSAMGLNSPVGVDVSEHGSLAVADEGNNRVLVWNRLPAAGAHGQPAGQVIGKADFTSGGTSSLSAKELDEPQGVRFHGTDLVVVDHENRRVLVWRGTVPPPVPAAPAPAMPSPITPTEPELPGPGVGAY